MHYLVVVKTNFTDCWNNSNSSSYGKFYFLVSEDSNKIKRKKKDHSPEIMKKAKTVIRKVPRTTPGRC
jgi:hypothetical protein